MIWPPQSADLNPIENLWDTLENDLRAHSTLPSSIEVLGDTLLQLWPKILMGTERKLTATMPRRMKTVKGAKGGPTKY